MNDYDENARFYSEAKIYQGKQEIHGFFSNFIDSLPAGAIDRFSLRSLQVDGNIAYITWSVGTDIPMGTDTFVVGNGKIVSQTFAMYAVPAHGSKCKALRCSVMTIRRGALGSRRAAR